MDHTTEYQFSLWMQQTETLLIEIVQLLRRAEEREIGPIFTIGSSTPAEE